MAEGLKLWDAAEKLVLDTTDRVAGGTVFFNTGKVNGSYTATSKTGQTVEFVYNMPGSWNPAGNASPWPTIAVVGNSITWSFNSAVVEIRRFAIDIMVVTY